MFSTKKKIIIDNTFEKILPFDALVNLREHSLRGLAAFHIKHTTSLDIAVQLGFEIAVPNGRIMVENLTVLSYLSVNKEEKQKEDKSFVQKFRKIWRRVAYYYRICRSNIKSFGRSKT